MVQVAADGVLQGRHGSAVIAFAALVGVPGADVAPVVVMGLTAHVRASTGRRGRLAVARQVSTSASGRVAMPCASATGP
ncbi:hypothetical protein Sar04_42060 [Salinispora arenicola]|uniref:Uncharacterized protein n=1 Tax=Salinispora arenicola TaxID=168697 RepID=A0ABQ4JX01_SALAC|nr:hypothetical protein Sar04_42060 [Salinispora arenicola]